MSAPIEYGILPKPWGYQCDLCNDAGQVKLTIGGQGHLLCRFHIQQVGRNAITAWETVCNEEPARSIQQ